MIDEHTLRHYLTRMFLWGELAGESLVENDIPINPNDCIESVLEEISEGDNFFS